MHHAHSPKIRKAITLVEVIFSIGVILIGLLGLMSILPLAGRRAQDSISLSVGAELSESVFNELQLRKFLSSGRLIPIPVTLSTDDFRPLDINDFGPATMVPFCIDPLFASKQFESTPLIPTSLTNGYDASKFPFYVSTHDPLLDPSNDSTTAMSSTNWPATPSGPAPNFTPYTPYAKPRAMIRVGIKDAAVGLPLLSAMPGTTASQLGEEHFVSVEEALALVESYDDLPVLRPDDRTRGSRFSALNSGTLAYGKRVPTGEFSWIATVNPFPGNIFASVSVVIIRNRERTFQVPQLLSPPDTPRGNALAERCAYVSYASGFSGGAGGIVHLVSSGNTVSKLLAGDWIMLSRTNGAGDSFHRWYRVVAVGEEPEVFTPTNDTQLVGLPIAIPLPDPNSMTPMDRTKDVWRHKVVLDGPDWSFGFTGAAGAGYGTNTYATIVDGVVSVTERVVLLRNL